MRRVLAITGLLGEVFVGKRMLVVHAVGCERTAGYSYSFALFSPW